MKIQNLVNRNVNLRRSSYFPACLVARPMLHLPHSAQALLDTLVSGVCCSRVLRVFALCSSLGVVCVVASARSCSHHSRSRSGDTGTRGERESRREEPADCAYRVCPNTAVMEGGSLLSMIAGFLPPSSDPLPSAPSSPPRRPSPTMSGRASTAADDSGSSCQTPADAAAARSAVPGRRLVHMICFSKDRAFQLDQLLASASRHLCLAQEGGRQGGGEAGDDLVVTPVRLGVSVLYLATAGVAAGAAAAVTVAPVPRATAAPAAAAAAESPGEGAGRTRGSSSPHETMEESYDLVRRRHPNVRFLRERPGEFCTQLRSLVGEEWEESAKGGEGGHDEEGGEAFVLFAVDDMFFYRDFGLHHAVRLLATGESWTAYVCLCIRCFAWRKIPQRPLEREPLFSGKACSFRDAAVRHVDDRTKPSRNEQNRGLTAVV